MHAFWNPSYGTLQWKSIGESLDEASSLEGNRPPKLAQTVPKDQPIEVIIMFTTPSTLSICTCAVTITSAQMESVAGLSDLERSLLETPRPKGSPQVIGSSC